MDRTAPRIVLAIAFIAGVAAFLITLFAAAPQRRTSEPAFGVEIRSAFVQEDWDAVIKLADAHLEVDATDPEALFFLGEGYLRRDRAGDADHAERTWNRIVAATHDLPMDPRELPEGLWAGDALWRGWALDRLGRAEEAREAWSAGADAIAELRRGRGNRGNLRLAAMLGLTGRVDEAWPYLRFAAGNGGLTPLWADADPTLDPLRTDPLFNLITDWNPNRFGSVARRLMSAGNHPAIVRLGGLETRIDPGNAEAWLFTAFALERLDRDASDAWCGLARAVAAHSNLLQGGEVGCDDETLDVLVAHESILAGSGHASHAGWVFTHYERTEAARSLWLRLARNITTQPNPSGGNMYNAACYLSLAGEHDEAVYWLDRGVDAGYREFPWIEVDPDLDPIRTHPAYDAALSPERSVEPQAGMAVDLPE